MGRFVLALLMTCVLLSRPAAGCDPVLLQLIRGQDKQSEFDRAVEQISSRLGELAVQARGGRWAAAGTALTGVQRDWVGLYASNYLSQRQPAADWQSVFDDVSRMLGQLESTFVQPDFEKAHPVIREIQDRLIRFYRGRADDRPAARFLRARELARSLGELAGRPNYNSADAGAVYLHLRRELERLPEAGAKPQQARAQQQLKAAHDSLKQPEQLRQAATELVVALEQYRQVALDRLWFPASEPNRKESTK